MSTFGPLPPLTRLYRACEPNDPISPDDPRYVNCDAVRGDNLPRRYERDLRLSDPLRPEVMVFAGHRGVGKSSELLRLKNMLERPDVGEGKPYHVLFTDVSRMLDLNDLDFPDLLVFLAGEVQRQLRDAEIPGFSSISEPLRSLADELISVLRSKVTLTGKDLEIPYLPLAVELKNRPNSRSELRSAIEKQSTNLLGAVNDLLQLANVKLRESGREGLVLIVDGLDKMVRRSLEGGGDTHERLFIRRSEQLAAVKTHVIYTVPISLIYSRQFTQLEQTLGNRSAPVPMIRLRGEDRSDPAPSTGGMQKMREMLEKRCEYVNVDFQDVFDAPETCAYLCEMTGGHPRHLMMFIQAAASRVDHLPITRDAVERAVRDYANSLKRSIPDTYWPLLRVFETPQDDIPTDEEHQEMLLLLHIFEYMNGRPWYEVNPVLRTIPRFAD
jgi:hypothetical protein